MSTESGRKRRQELRDMGYRPIEIWLPKEMVHDVDVLSTHKGITRSKLIEKFVYQGLESQPELRMLFFTFFEDDSETPSSE